MTNRFKELLILCYGTQNKKEVQGWETLHDFDKSIDNKAFDFQVYKQKNRIVIGIAGTNMTSPKDISNDLLLIKQFPIPPLQFYDAEKLYNLIKEKYPDAQIETMGYSLGGSIANLLSLRTGIKSTALAPIGSKHIAEAYPQYFKFDDSNITTYGRKGDVLFYKNINNQSGKIYIIPDMQKENSLEFGAQHLLHNYTEYDFYNAKPYQKKTKPIIQGYNNVTNSRILNPTSLQQTQLTGFAAPLPNNFIHIFTPKEIAQMDSDVFIANESAIMKQLQAGLIGQQIKSFANFTNPITGDNRIFSREDIGAMSGDEYSANESAIMEQLKSIGIPTGNELEASSIFGGGTVYVRPYTRSDGTEVRGYWRSLPAY